MKSHIRSVAVILCGLLLVCGLSACKKPPEGKVVVTEAEFFIRQDSPNTWNVDARGKVRNVGDVDVRRVVVTGNCRSCGEMLVSGAWFINDLEKRPEQKAVINYLAAGAEEKFSFREVAFLFDQSEIAPTDMPDKLEIEIMSFEVVSE